MDFDRREELVSNSRSFGSGHLSNQSRKISIGIMADSLVKTRSKTTRDNEAAMPTAKKVISSNVNSKDDGNSGKEAETVIIGKQTGGIVQESSPWVYARSFHQEKSTSEAVHRAEVTANLPDASGTCNGLNEVDAAPTTCSVHYGVSVLQSGDGKQKKFDKVSCRRMGGKDGTKERVEEFSFATAMEILPENEVVGDKINGTENRREALRVKLWEILGTVSSPSKQVSQGPNRGVNACSPDKQVSQGHAVGVNVSSLDKKVLHGLDWGVNVSSPGKQVSQGHDMGVNVSSLDKKVLQAPDMGVSNLKQSIINKRKRVIKPRQDSDTIESDSENPGHPIKRPVTRSLSRKRAPSKMHTTRTRNVKYSEKNIFSFQKGFSGKQEGAVVGGTSKSNGKKRDIKNLRTDACKMYIPVKDDADEIQQATNKSRSRTKHADKTSSHGNRISFCRCPSENNSVFVEPEIGIQGKFFFKLPVKNMIDQPGSIKNSTFPDHRSQQEDFANSSVKDIADPHSGFQSPTFEIRTPTKSFSPGSPPKSHHGQEEDNDSPTFCSFNILLASKPDGGMESSADAEEAEDSPVMRSEPIMEERDAENGLSKASSEERDTEGSKEGSPISEGSQTESLTQEIGSTGKAKGLLYPSKRLRRQEDINRFSPISASPKGTEESPEDENQKDGLAKAIGLLGLALERVKSKIKSVADEKCAKALISVAEAIHLQLQNAESQIQRDVGKLTRLGKSKRKHLETEFAEQQEHLKIIYQKFKEEVDLHIKECRSTFEGLEAQEIEFRGIVEKHRTSQRKLLKQVEDAIETKLHEAQREITVIHKLARGKMLQLKYVLTECLKDSILS